ncbi:LysR family transcriptional regulator [Gordonia otitidis]|uniref:LysR family transcriptional regulator n=1 Tax=Gordonia otitidis (strain DSM 44809 / CCUG 52243 / JCM 12355 / NBRC 100426 / IFM 10032) TaxID=1108044 RepID=H5TL49_GORO1|nr:LysR family transcriptional regulator [Gordonia otitidis]GAB34207.1 putative LysR family transcriptional regulator [Gordonia otitidis NBRC 100426]
MDVMHLRYFLAVARELNFTRAAESLHMSAPPLSKRIKALESELDVRLFDRSTHHTALTDAGRALIPLAERVVADLDALPSAVRATQRTDLRLAVPDELTHAQRRRISAVADQVDETHRVIISQMPSLEMPEQLLGGEIDLAISHLPEHHPDLVGTLLTTSRVVAVVDASRFAAIDAITTADLRGMTLVSGPRHWDLRYGPYTRLLRDLGVLIDTSHRYSTITGMALMLRGGDRFTLVPEETESMRAIDRSEFTLLPISDLAMRMDTWAIRRADGNDLDAVVAALAVDA